MLRILDTPHPAALFPDADLDDSEFLTLAIRFGKALQLVNILRDLPGDLANGRCYLPAVDLELAGLKPEDLRNPTAGNNCNPSSVRGWPRPTNTLRPPGNTP